MNFTPSPIGWGARMGGSMFQPAPFTNGLGKSSPKPNLGQNGQTWFTRGKASVVQYDDLWARTELIANKTYREELAGEYHSSPDNKDGSLFRRNTVAYNIGQAESYTPVNYPIFEKSDVQGRVEKLEAWNHRFRDAVKYGESEYGILDKPETIERIITVEKTDIPGWVIPAGVVAVFVVLGIIAFKKGD